MNQSQFEKNYLLLNNESEASTNQRVQDYNSGTKQSCTKIPSSFSFVKSITPVNKEVNINDNIAMKIKTTLEPEIIADKAQIYK